jgi:transposase
LKDELENFCSVKFTGRLQQELLRLLQKGESLETAAVLMQKPLQRVRKCYENLLKKQDVPPEAGEEAKHSESGPDRSTKVTRELLEWLLEKLENNCVFHSAAHLRELLREELQVDVSESTAMRLLKEKLGYSWKKQYFSSPSCNSEDALLKRKLAAHNFIDLFYSGREIINVDESALSCSNYSQRSWTLRGVHHVATDRVRLNNYNVIAAVSTKNRSCFSVGNGSNNSSTFLYFLLGICFELQSVDADWRDKVVFQLDNAAYHRSKQCMALFLELNIPVFF